MKKGTKILITCVVAVGVAIGGVVLYNNSSAQDTDQAKYAQGIQAGEDSATVNINIQDDGQSGSAANGS